MERKCIPGKSEGIDLSETFKKNVGKFIKAGKVEVRKGFSNQFSNEFEKVDFLFIDGDHSIKGRTEDYDPYAHKVVKGGYTAFHDYYHDRPELGPTYVVNEIIMV